jgi:hypothetical protein
MHQVFFFRSFRIASLVLSYWSCFSIHTTYSSVPFKPTPTVPLQLQFLSRPTVPLQFQSLSRPTFPLQLPPLGRSAYSQPPAASRSLVSKLRFDSIQVEYSFHSWFRSSREPNPGIAVVHLGCRHSHPLRFDPSDPHPVLQSSREKRGTDSLSTLDEFSLNLFPPPALRGGNPLSTFRGT